MRAGNCADMPGVILLLTLSFTHHLSSAYAANEPAARLPKEGTWVRYHKTVDELLDGEHWESTVTLRFLESVIEDGLRCRWVEQKEVVAEGERKGEYLLKVLIPESALTEEELPGRHAVRLWARNHLIGLRSRRGPDRGLEDKLLWTPASLKALQSKPDDLRDVEHQDGNLKGARAWTGTWTDSDFRVAKSTFFTTFTIWHHPELPIGYAEARFEKFQFIDEKKVGHWVTTYQLQEFGTDAKSDLPENN